MGMGPKTSNNVMYVYKKHESQTSYNAQPILPTHGGGKKGVFKGMIK